MSVLPFDRGRTTTPEPPISSPDQLSELLGINFSDQQLTAITAPLQPGVIIAGAGSGKTTVMAARVVWLVGSGAVQPEQVLGLTFTRKAAAELSARVRAALDRAGVVQTDGVDEAGEQLIMTYDAFAARLVADHGLRIGVEIDPTMVTGATRYRLASRVVAAAAGPFEQLSEFRPMTITERVLKLDQELQQHLVTSAELDRHARSFSQELAAAPTNNRGAPYADIRNATQKVAERLELASLAQAYAELKRQLGVVEFADQMAVAARLAREVPHVSHTLRQAYRVVLLDEYQDTSAAQAAMLQGLFSGPDQASGRGHPVTAVGDPFQAIYGWRGAAASNINQFAADFPDRHGRPAGSYALTVNRRSGHTILDVANVLAAPLRADQPDPDGTDSRLVAPAETGPGEVHAATFATWPDEVGWICDRIVALGPDRTPTPPRRRGAAPAEQPRRWSDIAVLTRRNADIAELYGELSARDVPVEIVGLGGLLHLPEVADVVATLRLVDDITANPELVRLLTGPRWAIGARDLALLGRRAGQLAKAAGEPGGSAEADAGSAGPAPLLDSLAEAVADVDPTEVPCLLDAVESPGEAAWSARAREVFTAFAAELTELRKHADEPVLDLVRRVISTLGLDVELVATPEFARTGRADQLTTFVDAVAGFVDVDHDASLSGMLAWLEAEDSNGVGLERAVPGDEDSVKLLTVHKAKGLEWDVVFLPALVDGTFPSDRVTDNWVSNAAVVPSSLRGDARSIPQLGSPVSVEAMKRYKDALATDQRRAEDRLAYVAVTRARDQLYGSGHQWRPQNSRPKAYSEYLVSIFAEAEQQGRVAHRAPDEPGPHNPLITDAAQVAWPQPYDPDAVARRREAAAWVGRARAGGDHAVSALYEDTVLLDDEARLAEWDADAERLLAEARQLRVRRREVALPSVMSTTNWLRARADPQGYAAELLRPMPKQPSRAARFGTRFHRWVEQYFGEASLFDADDLVSADDGEFVDEDLASLCQAFTEGQFGARQPYRLEAPFEYRLAGRVIRGRIDAVHREPDGSWLVVDWKTTSHARADELQLAIYRLAWAELQGVPPERVAAGFYYVRRDELDVRQELPDAAALAAALAEVWRGPESR
ncbi:UvrD-helicase domain-containing protein [Microlunatus sp. Y2014]|uniref:UvrD-helicase domain-containing protein n=1 Tax=Microlunatus sp. Y2014 TaxID=3418488 RepID=UPI003DA72576